MVKIDGVDNDGDDDDDDDDDANVAASADNTAAAAAAAADDDDDDDDSGKDDDRTKYTKIRRKGRRLKFYVVFLIDQNTSMWKKRLKDKQR